MTNPDNVGGLRRERPFEDVMRCFQRSYPADWSVVDSYVRSLEEKITELCRAAPAWGDVCATCQGHGMIGWTTGQTPEQFDQHEAPCPDCSAPAGGEPNGKLVGWWNGITPGFDGMGMPSIRWGADAEDSRHDIPLYDGYNPIHYVTPVSAPAGLGEVALMIAALERDAEQSRGGLAYLAKVAALLRKLQQGAE